MLPRLLRYSWMLLGLSITVWLALTFFEPGLVGMSMEAQRLMTFLALVLPPAMGAVLGLMSILRREGRVWLALVAVILNALFAAFHWLIILFAG